MNMGEVEQLYKQCANLSEVVKPIKDVSRRYQQVCVCVWGGGGAVCVCVCCGGGVCGVCVCVCVQCVMCGRCVCAYILIKQEVSGWECCIVDVCGVSV